jgi:uncharacterized protein YpuA (DUF1002 family)
MEELEAESERLKAILRQQESEIQDIRNHTEEINNQFNLALMERDMRLAQRELDLLELAQLDQDEIDDPIQDVYEQLHNEGVQFLQAENELLLALAGAPEDSGEGDDDLVEESEGEFSD